MTGLPLIPLLPLLAAVVIVLLRRAPGLIAATASLASLLLAIAAPYPTTATTTWMEVGGLTLSAGLALDGLSWWMALVVASVCFLVLVYAIRSIDVARVRFFAWMSFFTGAMLALVLAESFVVLFAAWEGVGVASFALIAHHHDDASARKAARKAFLMTRFGDAGMLLAWLLVFVSTGTTSIPNFLDALASGGIATPILLAGLFLIAALGKSAQLPLTAWLPDAMAGPTPVSALLHSATMVAAGVYLMLRLYPLFESILPVLLWVGAATAVTGAVLALVQVDLKRVLAWSTVSQIGEMFVAIGLGGPSGAAFHLTTHAAYKSGLFLTAGAIDRAAGTRDLRRLGGLLRTMPWTAATFGVCGLALAGIPPLAGFWSEESILGSAQAHGFGWGILTIVLVFLAASYVGRAFAAVFLGRRKSCVHEVDAPMLMPMLVLAAAAALLGLVLRTPVERVLPFEAAHHDLGLWRWAAISASLLGLAASVGLRRGPVLDAARLEGSMRALPRFVAAGVSTLAVLVRRIETVVDLPARTLGRRVAAAAAVPAGMDRAADTAARVMGGAVARGSRRLSAAERGSDRAARRAVSIALRAASSTEIAERVGFGSGLDQFAYSLRSAGGRLRTSGKLYRYTMSLFVWVLAAAVFVVLVSIL